MSIIDVPPPAAKTSRRPLPRMTLHRQRPRPEDWSEYSEWASKLDADTRLEMEAEYDDPHANTDPADWPEWTDAEVVSLPGMPLPEWIESEAAKYRALDTGAADLIAESLEGLARLVRFTHAATPDQYRDRVDAYDGLSR